jgi:hypothetical protein
MVWLACMCYRWDYGWNLCHFFAVFKKTIGPGPAHAIDPTITSKGKDGTPHYSLSSRHKELVPFNTPGPGTYGPEKKATCFQGEKQPPAYSIGRRSKYRRREQILCARYKLTYCVNTLFLGVVPPKQLAISNFYVAVPSKVGNRIKCCFFNS